MIPAVNLFFPFEPGIVTTKPFFPLCLSPRFSWLSACSQFRPTLPRRGRSVVSMAFSPRRAMEVPPSLTMVLPTKDDIFFFCRNDVDSSGLSPYRLLMPDNLTFPSHFLQFSKGSNAYSLSPSMTFFLFAPLPLYNGPDTSPAGRSLTRTPTPRPIS